MNLSLDYFIKPKIFEDFPEIFAVISTKKSLTPAESFNLGLTKNSNPDEVRKNRKILLEQLGIPENKLALPKQIHSSNVCIVDKPGVYENCDGLVTDKRDIYLVVSVADCAPVYIFDRIRKVIALVHCGWRGAREKIVERTIDVMVKNFGSETHDIIAYIGPCASVCCYEVGYEFKNFFDVRFLRFKRDGKYHFDLKGEIYSQLVKSGLKFRNIDVDKHCTICNSDLFHSFRRDGEKSGRMWALFGIRQI